MDLSSYNSLSLKLQIDKKNQIQNNFSSKQREIKYTNKRD
jgi:hypothetical protein